MSTLLRHREVLFFQWNLFEWMENIGWKKGLGLGLMVGMHHSPWYLTQNYSGDIYIAHDILLGQDVVVKLEPVEGKNHTLEHKFNVYRKLGRGIGIPSVHWFSTENSFHAMVIGHLGMSLDQLFVRCNFRFSVNTVLQLASQLVSNLLQC
jgi:hypothetical protein